MLMLLEMIKQQQTELQQIQESNLINDEAWEATLTNLIKSLDESVQPSYVVDLEKDPETYIQRTEGNH